MDGAFTVFYFVNENGAPIPADSNYILEPTLAGITHIFAAPEDLCDNCGRQSEQGTLVTNTVPITSLLLDYVRKGRLESLRPEHVKPFLVRGLKWRVVSVSLFTSRILSGLMCICVCVLTVPSLSLSLLRTGQRRIPRPPSDEGGEEFRDQRQLQKGSPAARFGRRVLRELSGNHPRYHCSRLPNGHDVNGSLA